MSATSERFNRLLDRAKSSGALQVERAKLDYAVSLNNLLKRLGLKQAEFARRAGTSPAYITKVLRGDTNFTIETMVKLANAADGELCLKVAPRHSDIRWVGIVRGEGRRHPYPWAHEEGRRRYTTGDDHEDDRINPVAA